MPASPLTIANKYIGASPRKKSEIMLSEKSFQGTWHFLSKVLCSVENIRRLGQIHLPSIHSLNLENNFIQSDRLKVNGPGRREKEVVFISDSVYIRSRQAIDGNIISSSTRESIPVRTNQQIQGRSNFPRAFIKNRRGEKRGKSGAINIGEREIIVIPVCARPSCKAVQNGPIFNGLPARMHWCENEGVRK